MLPDDLTAAIARSWTLPLWPTIILIIAGALYLRGWLQVRLTRPRELPQWRAWCFWSGEAVLWLSLASPIDALGQFLLLAHMTQHLVLMSVAPPLLVLGNPVVPLLRGLPRSWIREDLAPWISLKAFEKTVKSIMHPAVGWIGMNVAFIGWHVPAAYELALRSNGWHDIEHACFFLPSMLFWWHVLRPWPSRSAWSPWTVPVYLIAADLVNTAVSAFLAFYGQAVYPTYASSPRIFPISPIEDQAAAGAEMWVIGSTIFLVPAVLSVWKMLSSAQVRGHAATAHLPALAPSSVRKFDLMQFPAVGALLRSRHGRIALQSVSSLTMTLVIVDGLRGIPLSSMNLAGVAVWNIIRPVSLLLIVIVGNLFCMACPFTLPRELARLLGIARLRWPRSLSSKWPAIALMSIFFWAYEQFALWDSPYATALLLLAYIMGALLVDSLFGGASFCKFICPIGQFNFAASLVAPLGVSARSQSVCTQCESHDCIRGNQSQRGCELQLYLPQKVGNMDCTMCMDCVKACPHNNVGITAILPIGDLTRSRSSSRLDIAVLLYFVSFASLMNAAYMIAPIANRLDDLGQRHPFLASNLGSFGLEAASFGSFLLTWLVFAWTLKRLSARESVRHYFVSFAFAALPLGLAIWVAHLGFHLATSVSSVAPMLQNAYAHLEPMLSRKNPIVGRIAKLSPVCRPLEIQLIPGSKGFDLFSLQLWALDFGVCLSLYSGWKTIGRIACSRRSKAVITSLWIVAAGALYAIGIWLFTQPMQMRGMRM